MEVDVSIDDSGVEESCTHSHVYAPTIMMHSMPYGQKDLDFCFFIFTPSWRSDRQEEWQGNTEVIKSKDKLGSKSKILSPYISHNIDQHGR